MAHSRISDREQTGKACTARPRSHVADVPELQEVQQEAVKQLVSQGFGEDAAIIGGQQAFRVRPGFAAGCLLCT